MTAMSEPRFGNCRDCAAWMGPHHDIDPSIWRICRRHPEQVKAHAADGCFDHIPALPSPPETDNG